jgi:serine/threonine protein kinase/lipoprotein NlpI
VSETPKQAERAINPKPTDSDEQQTAEYGGLIEMAAPTRQDLPEATPGAPTLAAPGGSTSPGVVTVRSLAETPADGTEAPVAAPPDYDILGTLGRGGMGIVYKARQRSLKRLVALKMLSAGANADPTHLARFYIEAEAVASLQHPNIVQIYEVGEHGGLPYFSLEFVAGGSLEKKTGGNPLPAREAAQLLETVARAMAYAHQQGVVHRDLKPANILLAPAPNSKFEIRNSKQIQNPKDPNPRQEGGDPGVSNLGHSDLGFISNLRFEISNFSPKVSDFGLAKRLDASDSSQTRAGTIMGTPSYMAPEQAHGENQNVGPLSDVYALGAVLYQLLTGRAPFKGATLLDTLDQVRNREPVPVRQLQPKVPRDLETICLKCLEKAPARRYASADALADDLRRFLADEPIRARPVGLTEHLWRWCQRNPRTTALSTAVVLLLVTVTTLIVLSAVRASRERTAIAEAGELARQRLQQATLAIAKGDAQRAQDLLNAPAHPFLESAPALAEVRGERDTLRAQVATFLEFKNRVDRARYAGLFGGRGTAVEGQLPTPREGPRPALEEARKLCRDALAAYDDLKQRRGFAAQGLPPLDPTQEQLLREDEFEAFLIAAQVEWFLSQTAEVPGAHAQAARQGVEWLNRAEKFLPPTRILYARRAEYEKALGDTEAAGADAARAEKIAPSSAVDHFWQGVAHRLHGLEALGKGNTKEGHEALRQAMGEYAALLRLRPGHFWGYFEWAVCQVRLGNIQDALVGFTTCAYLKPDVPWPYYNRGTVHLQLKQYDQAFEDFDLALERDPSYAEAYVNRGLCHALQGRHARAVTDYDEAIRLRPNDYALAHFHRAQSYRALKRYALARDDYSAVLRLQPQRADCYLSRALVNLLLKDFESALADAQQTARLEPRNPMPRYLIGVIYLGRRHYDDALAALEEAMDVKMDYAKPYLARAQIHHWHGRLSDALKDIDFALRHATERERPGILNDRADVYRSMGRFEEAIADYQRSIALDTKGVDSHVGLALVYTKQGKFDQARACYDQLVAADPGSATVYVRRAEFRRSQKQFDLAQADCDRAAELDRASVVPSLVRASLDAARGEDARAVAEAERLLRQAPPNDGHVLYSAACVWSLAAQAASARPGGEELARQYADRAAALLTETLDKGFHDLLYEEHNRMLDDPALAALRQHPPVRALFGPRWSEPRQ